jgi:hypothetical protein
MSQVDNDNAERINFWKWVADNTARIKEGFKKDSRGTAEEIGEQFSNAYPDLVWEICVANDEPWTFCVSANANLELFPQVQQAVEEAPAIPGWTVQAFRPRGSLDGEIKMDGQTLGYDDVWCEALMVGGRAEVVLHIRGATVETEQTLTHASLILMDNAVGEFDAATRILIRNIALLVEPPTATGQFFPLRDLPAFLDRHPAPSPR